MHAIVRDTYGSPDVLRLADVPRPAIGDDDVLVCVHAAAANAGDWHLLRGTPLPVRLMAGLGAPRITILGTDIAGTVEAVGRGVSAFRPGDTVFGELSRSGYGGYAEFVAAPQTALAAMPSRLSFEEAAALPTAGCTALQGLRRGGLAAGMRVLVHGASGGVGMFAVQIAKAAGAHVTAVCSGRHLYAVRELGADAVLDYTWQDFAARSQRYDLILAANGDRSIWDYRRALAPGGAYVMTGGSNRQLTEALLLGPLLSLGGRRFGNILVAPTAADLQTLADLCEAGQMRPIIDRRFPLGDVPAAIRYVEAGHASGKVVVTIQCHLRQRLQRQASDAHDHELARLERREADLDVHPALIDVVRRGRLGAASHEVGVARRRTLKRALAEEVVQERAHALPQPRPQRLAVGFERRPLGAAIE